jgi:hypothetical protein
MNRVFQVALEKHNDADAVKRATEKGQAQAERIAKAIEAAHKQGASVDHIEHHNGKVRVKLSVPHPDSNGANRKLSVTHEIKS